MLHVDDFNESRHIEVSVFLVDGRAGETSPPIPTLGHRRIAAFTVEASGKMMYEEYVEALMKSATQVVLRSLEEMGILR